MKKVSIFITASRFLALTTVTRSQVRARVEHVFGAQSNDMGGR